MPLKKSLILLPSLCQFNYIPLYVPNMPINISELGVSKLRGYREFVSARDIVYRIALKFSS